MPIISGRTLAAVTIACGCLLASCVKSTSQPAEAEAKQPAPAAAPEAPAAQATLASIFPAGAGRELVLNSCGSCHPAACVARGQRTAERWDSIRKDHTDKMTASSSEDMNVMFTYLKANFDDTKPEPRIPAEMIQQGCTPF